MEDSIEHHVSGNLSTKISASNGNLPNYYMKIPYNTSGSLKAIGFIVGDWKQQSRTRSTVRSWLIVKVNSTAGWGYPLSSMVQWHQ